MRFLFVFFVSSILAICNNTVDLNECIKILTTNDIDINVLNNELKKNKEDEKINKYYWIPALSGNYSTKVDYFKDSVGKIISSPIGTSLGISSNIKVYDPNNRFNLIKNKINTKIIKLDLDVKKQELINKCINMYMDVLIKRQLLSLHLNNFNNFKELLKINTKKYNLGYISRYSLSESEVYLSSAERDYKSASLDYETTLRDFNLFLGIDISKNNILFLKDVNISESEINKVINSNFETKMYYDKRILKDSLLIEVSKNNISNFKNASNPSVNMDIYIGTNVSNYKNLNYLSKQLKGNLIGSFNISIIKPIYSISNNVSLNKANIDHENLLLKVKKNKLEYESLINNMISDIKNSYNSYIYSKKNLELNKKYLNLAKKSYLSGYISLQEYKKANKDFIDAKMKFIIDMYNCFSKIKSIDLFFYGKI